MPFRLLDDETSQANVRRLIREQIDCAIAEIEDESLNRSKAVHQVRKRCKKIRSVLRLIRGAMGGHYDVENRRYRDIARSIAAFRDRDSVLEGFNGFAESDPTFAVERFAPIREILESDAGQSGLTAVGVAEALSRCVDQLRVGASAIDTCKLRGDGFAIIESGLRSTYRRARGDLKAARKQGTAEAFHEWRKQVKYNWYHMRVLVNVWPEMCGQRAKMLANLSDLLGHDHDLAILTERVTKPDMAVLPFDLIESFQEAIVARRESLHNEALPLGRRLFAESPDAFSERLRQLWKIWRSREATAVRIESPV